jgi:SAM-dependent methyltransferase
MMASVKHGLRGIFRYFCWKLPRLLFGLRDDTFINQKYHLIPEHNIGSCLDVGSGYGDFAAFLKTKGIAVTAIDIVDKGQHGEIKTQIFDGSTFPFPAKSFDTSIAMFILHYSENQTQLLDELGRVTRSRIIIGEDVTETALDKALGALHLWTTPWASANDSKGSFRSETEWRKVFDSRGWHLIEVLEIPRYLEPFYPINRRVFVIQP